MWQSYVFGFLAGAFTANGVPHFIKGVTGQKYQTPFGKPSSAAVNVVWGWLNFMIAAVCLHFAHVYSYPYIAFTMFSVGVLLKSLGSAILWSKHPENNK